VNRCPWSTSDPLYVRYHDEEWGVPERRPHALFEKLVLDGFQAGLSWLIILRKRDAFRRAFDGFDPHRIARFRPARVEKLMQDPGIVRNRAKIEGTIANARGYVRIEDEEGGFSPFLWRFVGGRTKQNSWKSLRQIPAQTRESELMSKALRERGFAFVGPTICYAFMQAVGMVDDHLVSCFRHGAAANDG
jgi:DNA-3-methyladenine glycosylase I